MIHALAESQRVSTDGAAGVPTPAKGYILVAVIRPIIVGVLLACVLSSLAFPRAAVAKPTHDAERADVAITDVTVVDVEKQRSLRARTVLIEDGRIVAVVASRDAKIPANTQRIDGRGRFLIPGLVDMHVHLFNTTTRRPANDWAFPLFVANGVTGVREMAAEPAQMALVNRWRKDMDAGVLIAPRILAVGVPVSGKSPDDATAQVNAAAAAGVDFIKVFSNVPASHWQAILDAARARSLPVVGHVPWAVSLLEAAAAGQRNSEHLMQAFEACSRIESQVIKERRGLVADALAASVEARELSVLQAFDRRSCRKASRALAFTGQVQGPTLVIQRIKSGTRPSEDPRWRLLRADEQARWERILSGLPEQDQPRERRRLEVAMQIVSAMHRAGVPIVVGTDAPMPNVYPGFSVHEELALLVESGLSPHAALRSATLTPAEFLGIAADSGSVAVGKRADLVLLDADPTKDIRNTQRINAVLLSGWVLRRADLASCLARSSLVGASRCLWNHRALGDH